MKRVIFGQVGRLRPEKVEEYKALHLRPWPQVLQTISRCNLQNYSIFLHGDMVFAYFEYTGENFDADMEEMAKDSVTQEWWTHTHPCFAEYSMDPKSRFYADMEQIFYHN